MKKEENLLEVRYLRRAALVLVGRRCGVLSMPLLIRCVGPSDTRKPISLFL